MVKRRVKSRYAHKPPSSPKKRCFYCSELFYSDRGRMEHTMLKHGDAIADIASRRQGERDDNA